MKHLHSVCLFVAATLLALSIVRATAAPLGTAFTYQGQLAERGNPVTGIFDVRFAIYDAETGFGQIGLTLTNNATGVTNGIFAVPLDFGSGVFNGDARWLEISVRSNGVVSDFTMLSPRQQVTPTPYALYAPNAGAATTASSAATANTVTGSVSASQLTGTISSNNIGAGSITTVMLSAGAVGSNQLAAGAVTTGALADGAVTAAKVATVSNWFALRIANPAPVAGEWFGYSVAAMGTDRVLIGAYGNDTGATDTGAAYLFTTNGVLLTTFTNPTPAVRDYFGYSVAAVGTDRVLIGAYWDDTGLTDAGAAYLFTTNGVLLTTFINPTPAVDDRFGWSVAAVGSDRVLIGAYLDDTAGYDAGAAYLFSTNGALVTTFTKPTPTVQDYFGYSVASVGTDRVLIGAEWDDTGAFNTGAAYLFSTNGAPLTTFTNPTPADSEFFGHSVAAVGTDRVLIGAPYDNLGASHTGAAYLFDTNGALLATFINPTPADYEDFGRSVAAVGTDRVLIGAPSDSTGAANTGATYLFSTDGTLLTTFISPKPTGTAYFGYSVAAVGSDQVLIGAFGAWVGPTFAGAAYLFSFGGYTPGLVAEGVRPDSITTAGLTDGAVTSAKIGGALSPSQIPDLDASKITSGVLGTNRIPNLDASKITGGTLADARLSVNVALLNANQAFTGSNRFAGKVTLTNAANMLTGSFTGSGSGLTNLNASQLTTGTLADARLSVNVALLSTNQTFAASNRFTGVVTLTNAANTLAGTFTGNGSGLTNLDATAITGTVDDARLSANVALLNAGNTFSANNIFGSRVGIGAASPDRPLAVGGAGAESEWISLKDTNGVTQWHLNGTQGGLNFVQAGVRDGVLFLSTNSNVGLSKLNPATALDVNGTVTATAFAGDGAGLTNIVPSANYVFSYSTTTQAVVTAGTFQDVTNNADAQISGWTHPANTASFTCGQSGLYWVQYRGEVQFNEANFADTVSLRAVVNGVEIAGSDSAVHGHKIARASADELVLPVTASFIASFNSSDILKFQVTGTSGTALTPNTGYSTTKPSFSCTIMRLK